MDYEAFARLSLDPVRLAALGRSVEGTLSADELTTAMGIDRRASLETLAALRLAGITDADDRVQIDALREVAGTLPKPEEASPAIIEGEWTPREIRVLEHYFSGCLLYTSDAADDLA